MPESKHFEKSRAKFPETPKRHILSLMKGRSSTRDDDEGRMMSRKDYVTTLRYRKGFLTKGANESTEVNEISKGKMWNYAMDAKTQIVPIQNKIDKLEKTDDKEKSIMRKRFKGLNYVAHKLTGIDREGTKAFGRNDESVEVNEVSKDLLKRYRKKADTEIDSGSVTGNKRQQRLLGSFAAKDRLDALKRKKPYDKAVERAKKFRDMTKESAEVNEVSKKLLGRYISGAVKKYDSVSAKLAKTSVDSPDFDKGMDKASKITKSIGLARNKYNHDAINKRVGWPKVPASESVDSLEESKGHRHFKVHVSYSDGKSMKTGALARNSAVLKIKHVRDPDHAREVAEYKNKGLPGFKVHRVTEFHESVEVNEISKKLLGRYIKKSTDSVADNSDRSGYTAGLGAFASSDEFGKVADKRKAGIKRAVDKITGSAKVPARGRSRVREAVEVKDAEVIKGAKKEGKARKKFLSLSGAPTIPDAVKVDEANTPIQLHNKIRKHMAAAKGASGEKREYAGMRDAYDADGEKDRGDEFHGASVLAARRQAQHLRATKVAKRLLKNKG